MAKFHVYVDLTNELTPYYVGKGVSARVSKIERNQKHDRVRRKYGLIRVVVFETDDETEALNQERQIIADCQTCVLDFPENRLACNLLRGGLGNTGWKHTEDHIRKISGEGNHFFGKKHTEETKLRIRATRQAQKHISGFKGKQHDEAAKEKNRQAHLGKQHPYRGGVPYTKLNAHQQFAVRNVVSLMMLRALGSSWESIEEQFGITASYAHSTKDRYIQNRMITIPE